MQGSLRSLRLGCVGSLVKFDDLAWLARWGRDCFSCAVARWSVAGFFARFAVGRLGQLLLGFWLFQGSLAFFLQVSMLLGIIREFG